jgi:hypothetical protein
LLSIAAGVFQARHSHVWARRCYGSKINKDKFIKVTIGLAEPMRKGATIMCLLMNQRSRRIDNEIQKSSRWLQGYTHAIQDSKAYTSSRDQQKQVIAITFSRNNSRIIRYLHSCSRLKCTGVLIFMRCYSHDAQGVVQGSVTMQ